MSVIAVSDEPAVVGMEKWSNLSASQRWEACGSDFKPSEQWWDGHEGSGDNKRHKGFASLRH
jgi:hypothetical protein